MRGGLLPFTEEARAHCLLVASGGLAERREIGEGMRERAAVRPHMGSREQARAARTSDRAE